MRKLVRKYAHRRLGIAAQPWIDLDEDHRSTTASTPPINVTPNPFRLLCERDVEDRFTKMERQMIEESQPLGVCLQPQNVISIGEYRRRLRADTLDIGLAVQQAEIILETGQLLGSCRIGRTSAINNDCDSDQHPDQDDRKRNGPKWQQRQPSIFNGDRLTPNSLIFQAGTSL